MDKEIYMEPRIREIEGDMPPDILRGGRVVHATGREVWDYWAGESGAWSVEYEDDDTVGFLTTEQAIQRQIENHAHFLARDCEGWEDMRADFRGLDLTGATISDVDLSGANFHGSCLVCATLKNVKLVGADFTDVNISGAYLKNIDMSGANLAGTNLKGAFLKNINLSKATLAGANLSALIEEANLSGANLTGADLCHASAEGVNFHGANFSQAEMEDAGFRGADFTGACLVEARMGGSDFCGANLSGADMTDANMLYTVFNGANLTGTNLSRAITEGAEFIGAELTDTIFNKETESRQLVFETENVRVFINGPYEWQQPSAAFYSPEDKETKACTATLNAARQYIEMRACRDVLHGQSMMDIAESLFEDRLSLYHPHEHFVRAGDRGFEKVRAKDLVDAVMALEEAIDPPTRMDRVEELQEMRAALREAITENIKERGLEALDTLGGKDAVSRDGITQ